jgi:hypothetical protein
LETITDTLLEIMESCKKVMTKKFYFSNLLREKDLS